MSLLSCAGVGVGWGWSLAGGWRRKHEERNPRRLLSNRSWEAKEQHLPGAPETLSMMPLPSKKDLKTAMEVFAVFQWALSAFIIGESSAFCRVTNCPGMPGTEKF